MSERKPVADPGPLGLAAFAMTTFVLSVFNAGLLDKGAEPVYLCLALFYGGLVQLLAGMWEFKNRNLFGATAFSSYAAFWIALGTYVYLATVGGAPLRDSFGQQAMGIFLVSWTIFTAYMWIASMRVNVALSALFTLLLVTYVLLDCAQAGWISAVPAGYCGILTAIVAWYISAAGVINETWGRVVLPVWPIAKSPATAATDVRRERIEAKQRPVSLP
jgi:succinate-acetate transporter protein